MSGWRYWCLFLLLTQVAMAEEHPTANQVIEYWIATQRELPVERVSFSRIAFDRISQHQTNQVGEVVYHGESSVEIMLRPLPLGQPAASQRPGYQLAVDRSETRASWDAETLTYFESDGTVKQSLPRNFQLWGSPSGDIIEHALPPLFPGPVNETYIHKFDWTISDRHPDSIWLKADPKVAFEKDPDIPLWEIIVNTGTWTTRAARQLDRSGNREVVMVVR